MSKFLEILKEKLSDPKYGWEEHELKGPTNWKGPEGPKGYYGNEDCLFQDYRKRKENLF